MAVVAVASVQSTFGRAWDLLSGMRSSGAAMTALQRERVPADSLPLPADRFDHYRDWLRADDRYFLDVAPSGFSSHVDLPAVVASVARFALLPAVQVPDVEVIWVAAHGIQSQDFRLTRALDPWYLADRADRLRPAVHELHLQLSDTVHWGYLMPLAVGGLLAAVAARRFAVAGFAAAWFALSFGGLLFVYWVADTSLDENLFNSANRTVCALIIGSTALVPLLAGRRS